MGPLMLDLDGCAVSADEKDILDHPLVGGVILFSRNYQEHGQLQELVRQIREYSRNRVLIAVDHEGGRVQRFRQDFSAIPAMGRIYNQAGQDLDKASNYAHQLGWLMAAEVLALDIDFSFAPVLDIHGISEVIGDRSFHSKPEVIIQLAGQFIQGMHKAGMKATGKHFPGHGNVKEDSHIAMPVDKRNPEEIFNYDMRIFEQLHQQALLDAVMPAHVIYPQVDKYPAGFSKIWMRDILRNKMNFDGVIFSDDLAMQGAAHIGNFADRAELALGAGCDMALVCNHREGAIQVLDALPISYQASSRLPRMAKQATMNISELRQSYLWKQSQVLLEDFLEQE